MSTSEDRLIAATVGKVESLNGSIALAPYSPEWPLRYAALERQIRQALGSKALLTEHVGSTSVPGLCAKPIIDIVLAVGDSAEESAYVPPLEAVGYALRIRAPDWFQNRMLKAPVIEGNIHVSRRAARRSSACWHFATGCEAMTMIACSMSAPSRSWRRAPENTCRIMRTPRARS
jgi:GrpB-like predicted nucleotidyltransferase (UPF0157 family)